MRSSTVKKLPAIQETQVPCEDPLKKGMAIHSNMLAYKIPQTEKPGTVCGVGKSCTGLSN